jgi:formylglycine-generating enzyme required for sulfatase activity
MRIPRSFAAAVGLILAAVSTTGCGGGGGKSANLLQDVSIDLANYIVLDLTTGTIEARADVPDLATNSAYRNTKMVFRAISAGSASLGQAAGTFGAQSDETPHAVNLHKFFIGVFETTQGQWQTLTGTTPWANVVPPSVVGGLTSNPDVPAFNLSYNAAAQALATASTRLHATLELPTDDQWEFACRAGSPGVFAWGDTHTDTAAAPFALVAETNAGHVGPSPVGSLAPNALGLYDMEGNVWEISKEGHIRGGSWNDTLPQARCANRVTLDPTTAHALVGVRLVLAP